MIIRINKSTLQVLLLGGSVILLFILLSLFVGDRFTRGIQQSTNVNLLVVLLTGLFTGGLTCLAVQGGLLAATIAQREEERLKEKLEKKGNALPILSFLGAKLVAYTFLGLLLGWFGSLFSLSLTTMAVMQVFVAVFMLGTALNILNVHPIFRYFVIQPPRFLTRLVRRRSKSQDLFAPAILGGFTVFIPCGTTQAMMALAIGSAQPFMGALILFAFVLGTSPIFFLLGYFTTRLSGELQQKFMRFAAVVIILLSVFTLNNGLNLTGNGIRLTFPKLNTGNNIARVQASSTVTLNIDASGYTPNDLAIPAGQKITLRVVNKDGYGCQQAFAIPKLGIQRIIRPGETQTLIFQAPKERGQLVFMCTMGMYTGVMQVI